MVPGATPSHPYIYVVFSFNYSAARPLEWKGSAAESWEPPEILGAGFGWGLPTVCVCVLIRGLWVKIYTHFFFLGWCMVDISNCWREPMASRPISISCLFKQIATMFKEESNS